MNLPYTDQAKRVVRSFEKIPEPGYPNSSPDEVWDAYYHFFQDAYHLKDWVANDKGTKVDHDDVNTFIAGNVNMQLLQGVVTNMKHLRADAKHVTFKEIDLTWDDGGPKPSPEIGYDVHVFDIDDEGKFILEEDGDSMKVEVEKKTMHPRKLAMKVLIAWNQFFKQHGLEGGFHVSGKWEESL